ncbi:MAG TPA: hypothetical protein DDW49_03010 [Deltaproteobacteria bacterium]|nr:hypothetical protein [Deltaproteobacteria bacterium]
MRVNPNLSAQQCLRILELTGSPLTTPASTPAPYKAINPMLASVVAAHLPGSSYSEKRLTAFTKHMGFDPAVFPISGEFLKVKNSLGTHISNN